MLCAIKSVPFYGDPSKVCEIFCSIDAAFPFHCVFARGALPLQVGISMAKWGSESRSAGRMQTFEVAVFLKSNVAATKAVK